MSEKPVTRSTGEIALLVARLSKVARGKGFKEFFGKKVDFQSAHRQLAVSDASLNFSYYRGLNNYL